MTAGARAGGRKPRAALLGAACAYFLFLLALNLAIHQDTWYTENDLYFYDAMRMARGESFDSWIHPPGYAAVLYAFSIVTGDPFRTGQVLSHAAAALTALLMALMVLRLSGSGRAAGVAFFLVAINEALLFNGLLCSTDAVFTALFSASLLAVWPEERPVGPIMIAAAGALAAAMCLVRYQGYALLPGLAVMAWFAVPAGRRRWPVLLAGAGAFVLFYLPILYHYFVVLDNPLSGVLGLANVGAHHLPEYDLVPEASRSIPSLYGLNLVQLAASTLVVPLVWSVGLAIRQAASRVGGPRGALYRGRAWGWLALWLIYFAAVGWHGVPMLFALGRQHYLPIIVTVLAVFSASAVPRIRSRGAAITLALLLICAVGIGALGTWDQKRRSDNRTSEFLTSFGALPAPAGARIVVGNPQFLMYYPDADVWRPDKTRGPDAFHEEFCERAAEGEDDLYLLQTAWLREAGIPWPHLPRCGRIVWTHCSERLCAYAITDPPFADLSAP